MIAMIAALPREVAGVVRGAKPDPALRAKGIHLHRLPKAVVVAGGMGAARATLAVKAAMAEGGVTQLISVGVAGACSSELATGTVSEAAVVIDVRTGERYRTAAESGSVLVTADEIAGAQEKARLAASYGAAMVDMEAATVARLALVHEVRFRAIKAISDPHDFDFEWGANAPFADKHGHFRTPAFALHIALRPQHWRRAVHLGRYSTRALAALWKSLEKEIANG